MTCSRTMATIAALTLMALAGPAAASPALEGTWRGTVRQGDGQHYPVVMRLTAGGGRIRYPTLHCGGRLTSLRQEAGTARYREHITHGRETATGEGCVDRGRIAVRRRGPSLVWAWRAPTGAADLAARAVLHR